VKTFEVRFLVRLAHTIEAETLQAAEVWARGIVEKNEGVVLTGVIDLDAPKPVEPDPVPVPPKPPWGRPSGGGSPGTPVLAKVVITEAIAEAA
jgi:hypothetical protein